MPKLLSILVLMLLMCTTPLTFAADLNELEARAQQGDAEAQYELGREYEKLKNYQQASYWIAKAAAQGLMEAQCVLGFYYYRGFGVEQNLDEAEKWYLKAAEQNDEYAQFSLGLINNRRKNPEKAFEWFSLAAEQKLGPAEYMVGSAYYEGQGVEKNLMMAYVFWRIARQNPTTDDFAISGLKISLPLLKMQLSRQELAEAEAILKEKGIPLD